MTDNLHSALANHLSKRQSEWAFWKMEAVNDDPDGLVAQFGLKSKAKTRRINAEINAAAKHTEKSKGSLSVAELIKKADRLLNNSTKKG